VPTQPPGKGLVLSNGCGKVSPALSPLSWVPDEGSRDARFCRLSRLRPGAETTRRRLGEGGSLSVLRYAFRPRGSRGLSRPHAIARAATDFRNGERRVRGFRRHHLLPDPPTGDTTSPSRAGSTPGSTHRPRPGTFARPARPGRETLMGYPYGLGRGG